jgi:hypothetical protein
MVNLLGMNSNPLALEFKYGERLEWACPNCGKVALDILKNSFKSEMTPASKILFQNNANPLAAKYLYSCLLVCAKCHNIITSSGAGYAEVDDYVDDDGQDQFGPCLFLVPKFFHPPLQLIDTSVCPGVVQAALTNSFELFFASPNAAANQARVALELLLTELGVPRFVLEGKAGKAKKRKLLTLHARIEHKLPAKHNLLKGFLLAGKWIGNEGSHPGVMTHQDVLTLYDFIEHILTEIYSPKVKTLDIKAKRINKNKGTLKINRQREASKLT